MKICFYTKHEINWASSASRIGVYLKSLEEKGYLYTIIHAIPNKLSQIWIGKSNMPWIYRKTLSFWHSRILRHLKLVWIILIAKKYDLVFIQKVNLSYLLLWLLKKRNKNLIYDFDDLCFWPVELLKNNKKVGIVMRLGLWWNKIQHPRVLRLFKHVIAGNKNLAEIASFVLENQKISIIPTSIDCNLYSPEYKKWNNPSLIIGWSGTGENHLNNLRLLTAPLDFIAEKHEITFKLIGAMYSKKIKDLFDSEKYRFVCIDWVDQEKLPDEIRTFDIGVMPLVDNYESRGKCGFKALAYMASGVPVVVSPVGVNKDIIEDGINGFWAEEDLEWVEKLSILINDKNMRKGFAEKGRKTVEDSYSVQKNVSKYIDIFQGIIKKP